MADTKAKSLEMRVAELEDKLSRLHITEAEINAHNKVAALSCHVPQPPPPPCVAPRFHSCYVPQPPPPPCVAPCIFHHSCYVPQPPPPPCVAQGIDTSAFTIRDCLACDYVVGDDVMIWRGDFGNLGY